MIRRRKRMLREFLEDEGIEFGFFFIFLFATLLAFSFGCYLAFVFDDLMAKFLLWV